MAEQSSWWQDLLVKTISGTVETVGESKLVEVLQTLHDLNKVQYDAAIAGGKALIEAIGPAITTSNSKIDDIFLKALKEAIEVSESNNSKVVETLPEETTE